MRRVPILVSVLVLAISAASATARAQDASPPASPGTGVVEATVDVGGRGLHLACAGAGSPTVLLESGGPNPEGDTPFVADVGPFLADALGTRVCGYDRAGSGQSDPDPIGVRTLEEAAADLRARCAVLTTEPPASTAVRFKTFSRMVP